MKTMRHRISRYQPFFNKRTAGFSLVELMVAMGLSLLLLAGVISIFVSSRLNYETTDRMSRVQENGRFALDNIARSIRSAGFVGCARAPNYLSTTLNDSTALVWNFLDAPIRGFNSQGGGAWSPSIDAAVLNPTDGDVLVIRGPRLDSEPVALENNMGVGTNPIDVVDASPTPLSANDVALIYSCEARTFFQIIQASGGVLQHSAGGAGTNAPGNAVADLSFAFRDNAEVIPVQTTIYYLRDSTNGSGTSLWRQIGPAQTEELIEGVDRFEIQFGVDTDGNQRVDQYVDADAVTSWDDVYTVSFALLVRSLEEYGSDMDEVTYDLLGTTAGPFNDRRMRRVFTTTAAIRNRVPT